MQLIYTLFYWHFQLNLHLIDKKKQHFEMIFNLIDICNLLKFYGINNQPFLHTRNNKIV